MTTKKILVIPRGPVKGSLLRNSLVAAKQIIF